MFLWKRKKNSPTLERSQQAPVPTRTRTIEERLLAAKRARKASEKSLEEFGRSVASPTTKSKMDEQLEILKKSVVSKLNYSIN